MASGTLEPTPQPPPPPPPDRLSLESIPTVDLRHLSQSELTALSLCSTHAFDLRRCDDVVIPKIDRTVFNESAGSRKQTFSRLRLAPRNPNPNLKPRPAAAPVPVLDSDRADNARIVSLFKTLFNLNNGIVQEEEGEEKEKDGVDELALVPVSVAYCNDVVEERMKVVKEEEEEREKVLVNSRGEVVDLAELAAKEDPYAEELRRRTEGKKTADELLGFITEVEGQWGSTRKKRKIVDANVFGDVLPNGWKVLIAIKKKQGRAWVFVRRYVSPNGRYFVSCKEVSSYLLSLTGPQELPEKPIVQGPDISMADNVASKKGLDISMADNVASKNVEKIETKIELPALPDSSRSSDHGRRQIDLHISANQEKQLILSKDIQPGKMKEACSSALNCHSTLNCHRCSAPFAEKVELLNHLLSCHKRKRRKAGAPIEDEDLVKDRKYECQFCDKIFFERSSYFGHVGMHVKNYLRSGGGTPGKTAKQKISETIPTGELPMTFSDKLGSAEVKDGSITEAPQTPQIPANNEQNIHVSERISISSPASDKHLENDDEGQNSFSHQMELNVEAAETNKSLACEVSAKLDDTRNTNDNDVEMDEAVDYSNVEPDDRPGSDEILFDADNDLCESAQETHAVDCVSSEVCRSPVALAENDGKQLDLGNNDSFGMVNIMENEGILPSEFDLPADNEQKSSNQISAYDSFVNEVPGNNCYDEEVKGSDDGLTYGSGSGLIDNVVDDEDEVEDSGSLEVPSPVSQREVSCGVTMSKIENLGHTVSDFPLERGLDTNFSPPSANQQEDIGMQNKTHDFAGLVNETEADLCSDSPELGFSRNYVSNYEDGTVRGSEVGIVQPTEVRGFQFEQTCSPDISRVENMNKKSEDRVSNLFFTSGTSGTHLDGNAMTNNSHNDVSNQLGAFGSFVDKQAQVSKSLLSCLSMNQHEREVSKNNVGQVSPTTTTMHFPGLDKVEGSTSNKSTLDFSNMSEMNGRFLSSVQCETVPEESSPFQLWGQQSCGLDENQSKVYGGASRVAQQKRSSGNDSLNMVGLQQPSGRGNNLNEVCMNEQSYVQHGEAGIFSRNNETSREGNFHGNTLNLAGFSQQYESGYNYNKPCINQQNYSVQHAERGAYSSCDQARQERAAYGNSLSLASVQQCDSRYSLNKTCSQQTMDTGYSLNKGYVDSVQGMSKLDNLGDSRDRDLMIGFGNSSGRPTQTAPTEYLWRSTEGNILPGGLVDSSSSQGQSSGSFQAFDFLSDKGGNDLYSANDKFDNMPSFEGLRSSVEPMEFSFMTTQESNPQLEHPKVLQYNTEVDPNFGSFPNMMAGHVFTTLCVWCGNEFQQDPLACEMQAGSIGYLCPNCKARMSGQFL